MPWFEHGRPFVGYTVAISAQGPSIIPEEVKEVSEIFPLVACKDTYLYAPNAKIIYACDRSWWFTRWRTDVELREHKAIKVCLDYQKLDTGVPDLYWLKTEGNSGFSNKEGWVFHGRHTGHQALNLVANMGASKIILMGYDARKINGKMHCHDRHVPTPESVLDDFYAMTTAAAPLLVKRGIQVVNTSLHSRYTCFPKMPFREAIEWGKEA